MSSGHIRDLEGIVGSKKKTDGRISSLFNIRYKKLRYLISAQKLLTLHIYETGPLCDWRHC